MGHRFLKVGCPIIGEKLFSASGERFCYGANCSKLNSLKHEEASPDK